MDLTSKSNTPLAQTADTEEVEGATAPSTSSGRLSKKVASCGLF